MIAKKWIGLTAGLAVAAAVAVVTTRDPRKTDARVGHEVLGGDAGATVDRIEIGGTSASLSVLKSPDGTWRLGTEKGFPADVSHVVRLVDELQRNKFQTVVAEKKEDLAELGLDSPTTLTLKGQGKDLLSLRLGNRRKNGGQYAAVGDEPKAYLLAQPVQVYADSATWETKTLLDLAKDLVQTVSFQPAPGVNKRPVALTRAKKEDVMAPAGLAVTEKAAASAKDVETILSRLAYARRHDASNESAKAALAGSSRVEVKTFDGRTYTVVVGSVGEKERKKYFAEVRAQEPKDPVNGLMDGNTFEVPAHVAQKFERGREDFVEAAEGAGKG